MENGLAVVTRYILISIISYMLVKYQYIKSIHNNRTKISWFLMVVISAMFTWLNWYSTGLSDVYGSDRINYMFEFSGGRSTNSLGLDCVFSIIKSMGGTIETAFYFTTFVCVFIMLIAYRISKYADYKFFALMLTGEFILFTFTALKQSYACAFACLFFVFALESKNKIRNILSVCFALLSFGFHAAGAILFPIYILLLIKKFDAKKTLLFILTVIILTVYLNPLLVRIGDSIGGWFPVLANKIKLYMVDGIATDEASSMAFMKYVPTYYIAVLGLFNRKRLANKIENYNKYLLISIIGTCIIMYSSVSYWFSRFTGIFYFPVFMFFVLMNRNSNYRFNQAFHTIIVYGIASLILIRKIILIFVNYGMF